MERVEASLTNPGEMRVSGPGQLTRPARVLLGWLNEHDGCVILNGGDIQAATKPEYVTKVRLAREAVLKRKTGLHQSGAVSPPPNSITDHIAAFNGTEAGQQMAGDGWVVKVADLRKVCALKPAIHYDYARERTVDAKADDLLSVARISIPLPSDTEIPAQFDPQQKTWVITSCNPNLRIFGNFTAPAPQGGHGFGFIVRILPSFLQVVKYCNRLVLRDGYHRSLGFLSRGIYVVPVFYKEFGPYDELGLPHGMLPQAEYLGDRPPLLPDYLAEDVSVEVALPAAQRLIVICGLETNPIG